MARELQSAYAILCGFESVYSLTMAGVPRNNQHMQCCGVIATYVTTLHSVAFILTVALAVVSFKV